MNIHPEIKLFWEKQNFIVSKNYNQWWGDKRTSSEKGETITAYMRIVAICHNDVIRYYHYENRSIISEKEMLSYVRLATFI